MNNLKITVEDRPKDEERRKIFDGLHRFNASETGDGDCSRLTVFLRDEAGNVVGGLLGETYWGWLYVEFMWIEEAHRRLGYGDRLLATAEREAVKRGCVEAHLDTFSFQAFAFYERRGYKAFGVLEDFPPGHSRIFMRKVLKTVDDGELTQDPFDGSDS